MAKTTTKADPLDYLSDDIVLRIFQFAVNVETPPRETSPYTMDYVEPLPETIKYGESGGKYVLLRKLGRFYKTVSLVSTGWKRVMDASLQRLADPIGIFREEGRYYHKTCLSWMKKHKLQLGAFRALIEGACLSNKKFSETTRDLIQQCGLSKMKSALLCLRHDRGEEIGAKEFLDQMAEAMPNVKHLCLNWCIGYDTLITKRVVAESLFSPKFFSLTSLRTLKIGLLGGAMESIDGYFFSVMPRFLPNLKVLELMAIGKRVVESGPIPIESKSLEVLNVAEFTLQALFSLDCPKLKVFRCKASVHKDDSIQTYQKVVLADNVPRDCVALLTNRSRPLEMVEPKELPFWRLIGDHVALIGLVQEQAFYDGPF